MGAFDLKRAIAGWRKELRRNPAFEDGQAAGSGRNETTFISPSRFPAAPAP